MVQMVKCLSTMWETRVQSLGQEDPLEKEMATYSSILAWRIPWTEEPGGNRELADVQAGFRKGRGTRDQIANICWIMEKAREFQKNIYFCFIDYAKAIDCVDHKNGENSSRDGHTRPPDLPLEKFVCRSGSNS